MSLQSNVQQLLQLGTGLQTEAQSGTPSGVNNGNPNSVYNWSSYIPNILRNSQGNPTGVDFNLLTSQPTASSPPGVNTGYTPPFTADPFAAMLMSQLAAYRGPSASQLPGYGSGNPMIDNILRNLIGGYVASPPPGSTTPPTGGGTTTPPVTTTPPGSGTTPPGGGTTAPQPGTVPGPIAGTNPSIGYSDYTASPIVGGGGIVGGAGTPNIGGTGGNLPTGTAPYIPNYGNFDNTGTVGPIWNNDPYGNNFSTGGTGAPANQGGGIMGAIRGAINGVVPSEGTPQGFFSDLLHTLGIRTGATTGNVADIVATAGSMGGALLPGAIRDAGAGFISGWGGTPVNIDMANGSANNFGFGDVSGGWGVNDVYTPTFVNPDFSLGNTATAAPITDINAYLEQMRLSEQPGFTGGGTTGYTQLTGGNTYDMNSPELTISPELQAWIAENGLPQTPEQIAAATAVAQGSTAGAVNAQGRTAEQEAAYRAGLDMQSNLAAQRYGEDIAFNGSPLTPSTRQR